MKGVAPARSVESTFGERQAPLVTVRKADRRARVGARNGTRGQGQGQADRRHGPGYCQAKRFNGYIMAWPTCPL